MKALIDTDVILDLLLDRPPFSDDAAFLLSRVEQSEIIGFMSASTVITLHHVICGALGPQAASRHIQSLLSLFIIAPVNRMILENAAASRIPDFQDAVLHETACHAGARYIVTRHAGNFRNSRLPVLEPAELLNMLEALTDSLRMKQPGETDEDS